MMITNDRIALEKSDQIIDINQKDTEESWLEEELSGCEFTDKHLKKRFYQLSKQLSGSIGQSIPFACEDWKNTIAAYRFLDNERVNEKMILQGHFLSTQKRISHVEGQLLILHDTSSCSYHHKNVNAVGKISLVNKEKPLARCGIMLHSSLVMTTTGLPLGLSAVKFWTRKKFKGTNALKRKINPTRVSIEKKESYRWLENITTTNHLLSDPGRCVDVGDRESDIYECPVCSFNIL